MFYQKPTQLKGIAKAIPFLEFAFSKALVKKCRRGTKWKIALVAIPRQYTSYKKRHLKKSFKKVGLHYRHIVRQRKIFSGVIANRIWTLRRI